MRSVMRSRSIGLYDECGLPADDAPCVPRSTVAALEALGLTALSHELLGLRSGDAVRRPSVVRALIDGTDVDAVRLRPLVRDERSPVPHARFQRVRALASVLGVVFEPTSDGLRLALGAPGDGLDMRGVLRADAPETLPGGGGLLDPQLFGVTPEERARRAARIALGVPVVDRAGRVHHDVVVPPIAARPRSPRSDGASGASPIELGALRVARAAERVARSGAAMREGVRAEDARAAVQDAFDAYCAGEAFFEHELDRASADDDDGAGDGRGSLRPEGRSVAEQIHALLSPTARPLDFAIEGPVSVEEDLAVGIAVVPRSALVALLEPALAGLLVDEAHARTVEEGARIATASAAAHLVDPLVDALLALRPLIVTRGHHIASVVAVRGPESDRISVDSETAHRLGLEGSSDVVLHLPLGHAAIDEATELWLRARHGEAPYVAAPPSFGTLDAVGAIETARAFIDAFFALAQRRHVARWDEPGVRVLLDGDVSALRDR